MKRVKKPRIALVYDRINTPHGGAEKVLLELNKIFPTAPIFTSVFDADQANWAQVFSVHPSFLQKVPFAKQLHRKLVWLMPLAFESLNLAPYDVILSVTSAEAKGVITLPHQLHICYLLTPTRYLYSHQSEYQQHLPQLPLIHGFSKQILKYLKWWDQSAKDRPDVLIPISQLVQKRVSDYYNRSTQPPLYPPIEQLQTPVTNIQLPNGVLPGTFHVVVSRLVSYKKIDVAIKACAQLNEPLLIIGQGPEKTHLNQLVNDLKAPNIYFLDSKSTAEVAQFIAAARTLLMPGIEDFGITALEAVSLGTPAIVHKDSGAAELIIDGKTGILLQDDSVNGLIKAIKKAHERSFDPAIMKSSLDSYRPNIFREKWVSVVETLWKEHYDKS